MIELSEILVRLAAQLTGNALLTVKENGKYKFSKPLSMVPENAVHTSRRHRFRGMATNDLLTLELANNSKDETLKVYDIGMECNIWEPR